MVVSKLLKKKILLTKFKNKKKKKLLKFKDKKQTVNKIYEPKFKYRKSIIRVVFITFFFRRTIHCN